MRATAFHALYMDPACIIVPSGITISAIFRLSCCLLSIMANIAFMLQASFLAAAIVIGDTVPL
jgi:hypothetical protein